VLQKALRRASGATSCNRLGTRGEGVRLEELLEITHLALVSYKLPDSGEVVPLLQIVPSKSNEERLLLVDPELASVLAAIITRLRAGNGGTVPLVARYDHHERVTGPLLPHLFQRARGARREVISPGTVYKLINTALAAAGLRDATGQPLAYRPHDFRRCFTTDAVTGGLPVHIAARLLGHKSLTTTETYQAEGAPGTCRYPGCASPARAKGPAAPGPRPGYCEQEVPEDRGDGTAVLVLHTAMAAFRRRAQLAGQPGGDRPVTAAVSRAAAIRDDALAAMSRLGAQLSAALDQLAVLGAQLAAAGDPEAAEAQVEAARAEAAAQIEQARAQTASQVVARHAAELDAAEARAAAAEAITAMHAETAARQQAEQQADDAGRALDGGRRAAAARIAEAEEAAAAARAEREAAVAAAGQARADAARTREQDQQRHDAGLAAATAQLAAANDTIAGLRDQLARDQAALDRERAEQHRTVSLLHDILTSRPAVPAGSDEQQPQAASGTGHEPADTGGNGTRRRAPR
jgi:Phage integrase family